MQKIKIPTLIVQGTVDTLFTLDEGIENYRILRADNVPTAMMWFCGGHGVCLTDPGNPTRVQTALINWLDRYVKGDTKIDTGARFDFIDQNGTRYTTDDYPVAAGTPVTADGRGILRLLPDGGSGPAHVPAGSTDPLAGIAAGITPGPATNAVNVNIRLRRTGRGRRRAPAETLVSRHDARRGQPTRVFAQLVDPSTGSSSAPRSRRSRSRSTASRTRSRCRSRCIAFTAAAGAG